MFLSCRHKVHRARVQRRKDHSTDKSKIKLTGLYFDGKRDVSMVNQKEGNKFYKKVTEEHISLLMEPGGKYVGHFTPATGSSRSILQGIVKFTEDNGISMDSILAIGCDGTNVNTGTKGGLIVLMEEYLGRPLHWFICMLHANELPLRHLFSNLDGKTSGPRCFTGPIGKLLQNCEIKPIQTFDPIEVPPVVIDKTDLSTDQKYLLEIYEAVSSGRVSEDLGKRSPGSLNHARWLTTANRILRLYVSNVHQENNLITLVNFVMRVYVPMWFEIKANPYVASGARHIFKAISLVKQQPVDVQKIVVPVMQRNAYFAHHEIILLTMITDERPTIRELAWRRIKKSRENKSSQKVREFKIPELKFDCNDYQDIISWQSINVTEPPATMAISDSELDNYISAKHLFEADKYPLHTQAVERAIKVVSEASSRVCGQTTREGFITARLASRERVSIFESKKDYPLC